MKIKVTLFGTLPRRFADYDPGQGLIMDMPEGARVEDLLDRLDIGPSDKVTATSGGQVKGPDAPLTDGMTVQLLQQVHGG